MSNILRPGPDPVAGHGQPAAAKGAPVYRGSPVMGSLTDLKADMFGTLMRAAAMAPVVRFRLGPDLPIHSYGVFTPEGAHRVLNTVPDAYRKDSRPYVETAAFFGYGLLTSQDEQWHRQRRFVAPLFTPRRLEVDYLPVLLAEGARMRDRWRAESEATTDVHAASVAYTLRAIGRVLFGSELEEVLPRLGPAFTRAGVFLIGRLTTASLIPRTWPTPANRSGEAARRDLYAIVDGVIDRRRAAGSGGEDLLGRLLRAQDDTGQRMTADEVRDQVLIFLLAGHETTATTLAFTLQLLARHPAVQRRVQEEARAVMTGGPVTGDPARAMPYTQQVLRESMRLFPPVYAISRYTRAADVIDGTEIRPGSNIIIGTYALHHSAELYPDPERFDPARFSPPATEKRHRMAWLPFGAGPHICIGAQLAMMELSVALGLLLSEGTVVPAGEAVPPMASGLVLRPAGSMPHRLVPQV